MKRQQLWLWGHKEGLQNKRWGLIGESKISPADACRYMEIENIIMVREFGKPEPPYEPYMESFRPLKNVVWSLVGAGGSFEEGELERITALKKGYPNLTGAMMDDFFIPRGGPIFSPAEVGQIRKTLNSHSLKLWTVLYSHQLDMKTEEYLKECDLITFWTWRSEDLNHLEENFKRFVLSTPGMRRMLGCYMWDYGNNRPMPLELMKKQCSLGLKWLEERTVEGMIFLASCICDLGIETVEWTKRWIAE